MNLSTLLTFKNITYKDGSNVMVGDKISVIPKFQDPNSKIYSFETTIELSAFTTTPDDYNFIECIGCETELDIFEDKKSGKYTILNAILLSRIDFTKIELK